MSEPPAPLHCAPSLRELLALEGADFVRAGYRAVLQRDPDPQGFIESLDRLASGTDKAQWLQELRRSPEGLLRHPLVDGLDLPVDHHDEHALSALWLCDSADFVPRAYALLLGRQADPAGLTHYNARLQAGVSRERIVAEIGNSEEFAMRSRVVPGLAPLLKRHRFWLNPVVRLALSLARRLWEAIRRIPANPAPKLHAMASTEAKSAAAVSTHIAASALDSADAVGEARNAGTATPSALRDSDAKAPAAPGCPAPLRPALDARSPLLSQPPLEGRADWPPVASDAAVTIVSKNYLAFARVLARSYLKHHPDHDFIVVLVDRADDLVPLQLDCGARVIEAAALRVPDLAGMICRYSIMELNTAVKPFVLEDLFARGRYQQLIYLDPDIQVYQPLTPVQAALRQASVVLTPHLRQPCWDDGKPSETAILQSGTYNLGFIALRRGDTSRRLLAWWKAKLFRECVVDLANGLFVDQKWIDLVPGFFPDHGILYHAGCNAAYWNLHERCIIFDGQHWWADGQPLVFFHFSGYLPYAPDVLSKHQDRHQLNELPPLRKLTDEYALNLRAEGYETSCRWPYGFGTLPNGVRLPLDLVARATRMADRLGAEPPCPVAEPDAFCRFLMSRGVLPNHDSAVLLFHGLLSMRPDVVAAFPGCEDDHDHPGFRAWVTTSGVREYQLQDLLNFEHRQQPTKAAPSEAEVWAGVHRILHVYFVRTDLQAAFPDLSSPVCRKGWLRWLRAERASLRLEAAAVDRFETWADSAADWLAFAAFLYRHDGQPRRLQPGLDTLEERRRQVHSPMTAADLTAWLARTAGVATAHHPPDGINLAGDLDAPTGVGESCRGLHQALRMIGRTVHTLTLPHPRAQPTHAGPPGTPLLFGWPASGAAVSISVVNADSVDRLRSFAPPSFWGARNVGYWVWETDALPAAMGRAAQFFDEIWTPSRHSAAAITQSVDCQVNVLPHALDLASIDAARADRAAFGLPADGLLLGFAFDPASEIERKNVAGLIDAFEDAFRPDDNCWLVLKVNPTGNRSYAFHEALSRVRSKRVLLLQQVLSRTETFSFMRSLDAYVSLHRAEGFALTCAEAMACGLPVVASAYSGNLDFMDDANSLLVPAPLVRTDRPFGPYPAGTRWCAPDRDAAVAAMRQLLSADRRHELGERGRASVRAQLSPAAVGRQLAALLEHQAAVPRTRPYQ